VTWDEAVYSTSTENSTAIDLLEWRGYKICASILNLVIVEKPIYCHNATITLLTILRLRTRHARVARDL
jgi:hypothetical protein